MRGSRGWRDRTFSATVIVAAALLGWAGGCASNAGRYQNVMLTDPSIALEVRFEPPTVTRTEEDLLRVGLPLRSRSDRTLELEHRVVWLDGLGRPMEPRMAWRPMQLEPGEPRTLSYTATSADAADYSVQFRWGGSDG